MAKIKDLTGVRFGKLVCLEIYPERKNGKVLWVCQCDCGNKSTVYACNLANRNTTSCGCMSSKNYKTDGKSSEKIYKVWCSMKSRCSNPTDQSYKIYGEKGITVCDEWMNFEVFYKWAMLNGYGCGLTIERKDNSKGYNPDNCKWIPKGKQSENTSMCRPLTFNGKTMIISQWAKFLGVSYHLIQSRIRSGWTDEEALSTPCSKKTKRNYTSKRILCGGKNLTVNEWALELHINQSTLRTRLLRAKKSGTSEYAHIKREIQSLTGVPVYVAGE